MMKAIASARVRPRRLAVAAALAALPGVVLLCGALGARAATPDALALASWRAAISRTPAPRAGCFEASYPSVAWAKVACVAAPRAPYIPLSGRGGQLTVGDGDDYAIKVKGLISNAVGNFPVVIGVKSETEYNQPNAYSLQINSEYFPNGAACDGAKTPSRCRSWLQYVYSSSEKSLFIEYWVLRYSAKCPSGWISYGNSCFIGSAAVRAPQEPITDLASMSLTGSAVTGGLDTAVFADGSKAYTTTGPDSVVGLAGAWTDAEFNIVGDGGGAKAVFNAGSSITVNIAVDDGTTKAPKCKSGGGTTGETNNLTIGACTAAGGPTPSITFVESN